jgi:hypothetical protein
MTMTVKLSHKDSRFANSRFEHTEIAVGKGAKSTCSDSKFISIGDFDVPVEKGYVYSDWGQVEDAYHTMQRATNSAQARFEQDAEQLIEAKLQELTAELLALANKWSDLRDEFLLKVVQPSKAVKDSA